INVVVGKLKKEKLLDYREIDIADLEQSFHGEMNLHIEEKMDLENAISQLPEKSRMVLILHDIEGYKHKEVGSFLKISPGTSKAHLHRARNLLREYLK
ncbi:MAG: RNA polymerase sigma factor, partial [Calditrichia bacterium]|nr:RNA polymerase sigma factor [Calditrichia bacterium]